MLNIFSASRIFDRPELCCASAFLPYRPCSRTHPGPPALCYARFASLGPPTKKEAMLRREGAKGTKPLAIGFASQNDPSVGRFRGRLRS